jgi:hypothetical protein
MTYFLDGIANTEFVFNHKISNSTTKNCNIKKASQEPAYGPCKFCLTERPMGKTEIKA